MSKMVSQEPLDAADPDNKLDENEDPVFRAAGQLLTFT
jgi:hypothetical protein